MKSAHISFLVIDVENLLKKPGFRSQVNENNNLEFNSSISSIKTIACVPS